MKPTVRVRGRVRLGRLCRALRSADFLVSFGGQAIQYLLPDLFHLLGREQQAVEAGLIQLFTFPGDVHDSCVRVAVKTQ